jgi:flagellar basal-body rod protein FlgG
MIRSLYTAASGMKAQQLQVDTIANNIANVNTAGFKKSQLSFRSLLYQTYREPGLPLANNQNDVTGLQIGSGTEVAGSRQLMGQGLLEATGNTLDLAIEGPGFFQIQLPSGELRYTRNGAFRQDAEGRLVTAEGYRLNDNVAIPPDSLGIAISPQGEVRSLGPDNTLAPVGAVRVHTFANPSGLKAMGGNYYSPTAATGDPESRLAASQGAGEIRQNTLERSNVETVDELVALIVAQRNYEVNSRAIRVSDEMLAQVTQLVQ